MVNAYVLENCDSAVPQGTGGAYDVNVDFDIGKILPQWRELESNGALTAFQTQAWLLPWYQIVAPAFGISPVFVTVRDQASGRPVMLLPLCRRRMRGVTRIEFPDLDLCDYNAPLLAIDFRPSVDEFEALWDRIVEALPGVDLVKFEKMPARIAHRPNPMTCLARSKPMRMRAWGIELPKSRGAYEKSLKPSARRDLRRWRRKLEADGPLQFVLARSEAEGRDLFATLKRQRRIRCQAIGGYDILSNPVFSRFYETVIFDNWVKQFGSLSALMVGGEIAATGLGLNHRNQYVMLLHSFETGRWGTRSPGMVAIDRAITDRIEAQTAYFDLTIGNEPYKFRFGVTENWLYLYELGLTVAGRGFVAMRAARRFAEDSARLLPKQMLPKRLQQ